MCYFPFELRWFAIMRIPHIGSGWMAFDRIFPPKNGSLECYKINISSIPDPGKENHPQKSVRLWEKNIFRKMQNKKYLLKTNVLC